MGSRLENFKNLLVVENWKNLLLGKTERHGKVACPKCGHEYPVLFVETDKEATVVCNNIVDFNRCHAQFDLYWERGKVHVRGR